jgi:predicted ribosomally synthesized peptide with nif11-like leader
MENLKRFYKIVAQDPVLTRQLESITEKGDFIARIIQLGKEKGYNFNPSEVEASIAENTASGQGQFFCLPVGCWHKAEAV